MRVEFSNGWSAELHELTFGQMRRVAEMATEELAAVCVRSLSAPSGAVLTAFDDAPHAVVLSACAEAVRAANSPLLTTGPDTATTPLSEATE